MPSGQVDYCRGRYIHGWAIPEQRSDRCRIAVVDPTGRVVAGTIAAEPRADLAVVGEGRTDYAFRVGVPLTEAPGPFHLMADGQELVNSPIWLDATQVDGELRIDNGTVIGWVCGRTLAPIDEPVRLLDQDGELVLSIVPRPDVSDTDPLFQPMRFSAALPASCFGRTELCLTLTIGDGVIARAFGHCRLKGYLDRLGTTHCAGWLLSPDAPDRRFDIVVYRDNEPVGSGRTILGRPDVSSEFGVAGECGFDITWEKPDQRTDSLDHISIRLAGTDHELFDGPRLLGSRPAAIQQAYDAVQAHAATGQQAAILRDALAVWLQQRRSASAGLNIPARAYAKSATGRRLTVVVPVYSGLAVTATCLRSVLAECQPDTDAVVIVNDNPGDGAIRELVDFYGMFSNTYTLHNDINLGFIGSVNRGLAFVRSGDVLLLNADTEMFPGTLTEMHRVLHADDGIGTVTPLSNNATLFSYPHPDMVEDSLDDTGWQQLAAVALQKNANETVPIPTAHGFCMLIRRETLDETGLMDPAFGRGYGEENDFCVRAAGLGWRHVVAGGALVRHAGSVSFGEEKAGLLAANLKLLDTRYPDYHQRIKAFEMDDPVRRLRWPLDFYRLRRLAEAGVDLELVIGNWLEGGMRKAAADIDAVARSPRVQRLCLTGAKDGTVTLELVGARLRAVFRPDESTDLFAFLQDAGLRRIVVHHLLGFNPAFVLGLKDLAERVPALFHVHDYYYLCPRVTLIDASGSFCGGAAPDRCGRCIELDGAHSAYRMNAISPARHRAMFQDLLSVARHVTAPSADAANRLASLLPGVHPVPLPHPQSGTIFPSQARRGSAMDICLLGAIGPHKGSATLLALARHAWLHYPKLRFHVIGHTNIDDDLERIGNVTITGRYRPDDLPGLIDASGARTALFLHGWPETFSYTLTEAVSHGLIPVAPDIGAPAERIRAAGFGAIFPFPIDVDQVARLLLGLADGSVAYGAAGGSPRDFDTSVHHAPLRSLYQPQAPAAVALKAKKAVTRPKPRRVLQPG